MKRHIVIGWFLLLALSACRHSVETQNFASLQSVPSMELQSIDSLMWQQPDSALALLLPWFDTCRDAMLASPTDPAGDTTEESKILPLSLNTVEKYRTNIRKKAGIDPIFNLIR